MIPLYDNEETVCGILFNKVPYFFLKNLQGDIIAIVNSIGETVVRYRYDAWGACTILSDNSGIRLGFFNPYRYRGYYYDRESNLYYLQSRYYDPAVGRFINADSLETLLMTEEVLEFNLYGYCNNDPANLTDPSGYLTLNSIKKTIKKIISKLFNKFVEYLNSLIVYKDGRLSIRLSLISTAIESVLFLLGSVAAFLAKKALYKIVSKILFPNPSKAKTFVSWFIDLWKSTEVIRIILWALSVKIKNKAQKIQGLLSDFAQNLLSAKSKILDIAFKVCQLTSFAGFVAFAIGLIDGNFFDDYLTIKLY